MEGRKRGGQTIETYKIGARNREEGTAGERGSGGLRIMEVDRQMGKKGEGGRRFGRQGS
jgi:hypothetical protein